MSNSVNFKVNDTGVTDFMDKISNQSSKLTEKMIADTQKLTNSYKEQVQLIQERVRELQKLSRLQYRGIEQSVEGGVDSRLAGIGARGQTIDTLYEANRAKYSKALRSYKSGDMGEDEFQTIRDKYDKDKRRIERLGDRNTAENITQEGKDQIREMRDQSRQNQMMVDTAKQQIDAIERTSKEEVAAVTSGNKKNLDQLDENATEQEKLANNLAREKLEDKKEKEDDRKGGFWKHANAITLDRLGAMAASMPQAKDELEFARPMMGLAGGVGGAGLGSIAEALTFGQIEYAQIGAQLGSKLGEFVGSSFERTFRSRDRMESALNRTRAISGRGTSGTDLSGFGMDFSEAGELQSQLTTMKGSQVGSGELSKIAALQAGYGVNAGGMAPLYELMRANQKGDQDLPAIVAGIKNAIFGDGDRSFLNQFLTQNYAQLSKTLLATQASIQSGTAVSILEGFEKIGGQWGMKDFRSMGNIQSIQQALSSPGSDAAKALSFHVMRQQFPELSLLDTQIEIQKGLGSEKYASSMIKTLIGQGGDKSYQVQNIASFFGLEGNLSAAKELYEGYMGGNLPDAFENYNISGGLGGARTAGLAYTSKYTKSAAEIENAYVEGAIKGLTVMEEKMQILFVDMITEVEKEVSKRIKEMFGWDDKDDEKPKSKWTGAGGRVEVNNGRVSGGVVPMAGPK